MKIDVEKHLIMHFPEIKEVFYAKCAILVEGVTEYGCISAFADKIGISLDDCGICVIDASGEKTIKPIRQLLNFFAIPSVSIYDGDVKNEYTPNPFEFFTSELCFEIEIVKKLFLSGKQALVRQIARDVDHQADVITLDSSIVSAGFKKMKINLENYIPKRLKDVNDSDEEDFCKMFSSWFIKKKGVLLGRIIGEAISAEDIPDCYKNAIKKAQEVTKDA